MKLLVLPGDGIGPEIVAATVEVVEAANRRFNLGLDIEHDIVGLESLEKHGETITDVLLDRMRQADATILGPVHSLAYPPKEQGGRNPSGDIRSKLDLFANVRPAKTREGVPAHVKNMDMVIARENTEGFYADRTMFQGSGEFMPTPDMGMAIRKITRHHCERIARVGFELAMQRRKKVSLIHKANVLRLSDGLFLESCHDVAKDFPEVEVEEVLIDAMMALVVRTPERFDVAITTNMFGDILSDLTAELSGGLGLASSINAGTDHVIAQAAHGSAPDIAGQNRANPTSLIMSTAQLFQWLGQKHGRPELLDAAQRIGETVDARLADPKTRTADLGGPLGTDAFGKAVAERISG